MRRFWVGVGLLSMMTALAYARLFQNGFVDFDDNIYVTQNPHTKAGLSLDGLIYAFSTLDSGNWIPITWISYQLDSTLFGYLAAGYHATNLSLHLLNVVLLFSLLSKTTSAFGRSFVVAAVFATHPLHVESVAWIAERKDVLSAFWMLISLHAYARYSRRPSVGWYAATAIALTLGVLSKSMIVTLPLLMLIFDFWPLGRLSLRRSGVDSARFCPTTRTSWLMIEKCPLLLISLIDGLITIYAQHAGHAVGQAMAGSSLSSPSLLSRVANSMVGYCWYIQKTFFPANLCVYYPHSGEHYDYARIAYSSVLLAMLLVTIMVAGVRRPWLVAGSLWYFISLLPVIGLLQVGSQSYADRYSYVPQIGLLVAVVWELHAWIDPVNLKRYLTLIPLTAAILALTLLSNIQVAYWRSTDTLWNRVIEVDPSNWFAHLQIGNRRVLSGQLDDPTLRHLMTAIDQRPDNAYAQNNVGWIYQNRGDWEAAERYYRRAISVDPAFMPAMHNLIQVRKKQGLLAADTNLIENYVQRRPDDAWTINELGLLAVRRSQMKKARQLFELSLRAEPDQRDAR